MQLSTQPSLPNSTQVPINKLSVSVMLSDLLAFLSACITTVNMCFAVYMSGSIFLPDVSNPDLCENCPAQCAQHPFNQSTCCENFNDVKNFSIDFVETLAAEPLGSRDFSVV